MAAHGSAYRFLGDDLQIVEIELDPGEAVRAEAMLSMNDGVRMETGTGGGLAAGGLFGGLLGGDG